MYCELNTTTIRDSKLIIMHRLVSSIHLSVVSIHIFVLKQFQNDMCRLNVRYPQIQSPRNYSFNFVLFSMNTIITIVTTKNVNRKNWFLAIDLSRLILWYFSSFTIVSQEQNLSMPPANKIKNQYPACSKSSI